MTPEVAREMIPILEAIANGKRVERRCEGENWEPQVGAMILNDSWEFRIVPREFWIHTDFYQELVDLSHGNDDLRGYVTMDETFVTHNKTHWIKVREVTDD